MIYYYDDVVYIYIVYYSLSIIWIFLSHMDKYTIPADGLSFFAKYLRLDISLAFNKGGRFSWIAQ